MIMKNFTYKKIDITDTALMTKIYQLRYQVYAIECGFINANDYPDNIEKDYYDPQSTHFAAIDEEGEVIGTLRLILPGPHKLPIEHHCPQINVDQETIPSLHFAEISRLVITRHMRRRRNDGLYYEPQVKDIHGTTPDGVEYLRRAKPMAFGLYREMYKETKRLGITHWYTLMEKSLWLLLRIHGFTFHKIGEQVDIYGPVNPYLGKVENIEQEVVKKSPEFFKYLTSQEETSSTPEPRPNPLIQPE